MEILPVILTFASAILVPIGILVMLVGSIWFLGVAFSESAVWGIACMLIPFVSILFVFSYWDDAKKPFGLSLLGLLLVAIPGLFPSLPT